MSDKFKVSIDGKEYKEIICVPETSFFVGPPEATYMGEYKVFEQLGKFFIIKTDMNFIEGNKYEFRHGQ